MKPREMLHWLGVENEHSLFSWRVVLLCIGIFSLLCRPSLYSLAMFLFAAANHLIEGMRSQARTRIAMDTANEQAIERQRAETYKMECEAKVAVAQLDAQQATDAATLRSEMEQLRAELNKTKEQVKLLSTPEQMAKLQAFFKARMGV